MSTSLPTDDKIVELDETTNAENTMKRRRRIPPYVVLLFLLLMVVCVAMLFVRYAAQPAPLPDLLPLPIGNYSPPHYLFSIYGVDRPVGIALSPQGDRIYVTETDGDRLVKIFDREGESLDSFSPPRTRQSERSPVYVATDSTGRVFVADRMQHSVFVYDRDGQYLDTILGPALTLHEYVFSHVAELQTDALISYNGFEQNVHYQQNNDADQIIPAPDPAAWSPLGIRIDSADNILITDVTADYHTVREIPGSVTQASWLEFDPPDTTFGTFGQDNGQFHFPNIAVSDSQGRIFVSDSNNGRISVWDGEGNFLFHFGQGSGDSAVSLPRGAVIDTRDRLYVVDTVGQNIKVYDVSESDPSFLFVFGEWGIEDGQFNYPNDIALDDTGRLYITDRENNCIQVWSY